MAEKSIEEKTRRLASQRPENGKEFQQLQGAQNQLLEIQAAQKQNLMEQRLMSGAQAEQNQILAQAAEVGAQSVAGNMQLNQATAGVMGRYGLNQPRTSSQVKQQHRESVTRQNVTIHNNTTNITNNTVPANIGGPIQGRPIQFQQPQASGDGAGGMSKFKNWLNQAFARQEEAAKRRDREYQRREVSLTKSANKMMRKIEEFGRDITKKLDPRNVGRTVGGQLKTILKLIGIGVIAKNFDRILDWIYGAQDKVENEYIPNIKNFFSWIKGEEGAQKPGLVTKLQEGLEKTFNKLFFGKDSDSNRFKDKGLIRGIGDYFWAEDGSGILQKAWKNISEEFEHRSEMAKNAIVLDKSATTWDVIKNPGEALKEFLNNLTNYFAVILGGDAAMRRIQGSVLSRASMEGTRAKDSEENRFYDKRIKEEIDGKKETFTRGDAALLDIDHKLRKEHQYKASQSHMDGTTGRYVEGSLGAAMAASNNAIYNAYTAEYKGKVDTASLANNFAYLYHEASRGPILVNKNLFEQAGKYKSTKSLIESYNSQGKIRRPRADEFVLVRERRPDKDVKKDVEDIQGYKTYYKFRKVDEDGDGNLFIVNDLKSTKDINEALGGLLGKGINAINLADINAKIKKVPLYTEKIARAGDVKNQKDIIRKLTQEELEAAGYIVVSDADPIRAAAYGFIQGNEDNKMSMSDISFDLDDKEKFVMPLQEGLEGIIKNPGKQEVTHDFNATFLSDNAGGRGTPVYGSTSSELTPGHGVLAPGNEGTTSTNGEENSGDNVSGTTTTLPGDSDESQVTSGSIIYGKSGPFDVNAASEWITACASPDSVSDITGWCGRYVGQALLNGGMYDSEKKILSEHSRPNGGDYGSVLERMGWTEISQSNYQPNPGDVMVLDPASRGGGGSMGHVAMFTGTGNGRSGWFSDFDQAAAVSAYGKKLGDRGVHIYRYGVGYNGPKSGSPGHLWKKVPKENIFNFSVDWRRVNRSEYKGLTPEDYLQKAYNKHKGKWPKWATPEKLLELYNKGKEWTIGAARKAGEFINGAFDSATSGTGTFGSGLKNFFSGAKEIVSNAIQGLSHKASDAAGWVMNKAGDGVDWDTSLHNGVSTYEPYKKSKAEQYLYARYTGKDNGTYTIPSSISSGSTLKRDEWWAKFFDEKGNLKISKEDNINPTLVSYLHKIEGELKKGNEMNELDLKMAAQGLDAEMVHNAAETRDQKRLISALVATGNSGNKDRVQLFSDNNT